VILFLDTETTGLVTKSQDFMAQPGICQIGAVKLLEPGDRDRAGDVVSMHHEVDSFYTLVNPEFVKWEDGAMKTHGMSPETVKDAPTFFEIGPALARFAMGCRAWAGYNIKFDKDVLWFQLLKYGLERSFPWPPEEIEVMKLTNKVMEQQGKRGTKNPKLQEAYQHFLGTPLIGAHDALSDIRATVAVWGKINEIANKV
jgi:DNA polymerase-3 subunit epsilon